MFFVASIFETISPSESSVFSFRNFNRHLYLSFLFCSFRIFVRIFVLFRIRSRWILFFSLSELIFVRFVRVYYVQRLNSSPAFVSADRREAERRQSLIEGKRSDIRQIFDSRELVRNLRKRKRIDIRYNLVSEPSLRPRKEAIRQSLRKLRKERFQLSVIKKPILLPASPCSERYSRSFRSNRRLNF